MQLVDTYDYTAADGKPLYQVLRYEENLEDGKRRKKFTQRVVDDRGGFTPGVAGVSKVLYKLPSVLASNEVFVVAGEKDVSTLESIGLCATTNSGGESVSWIQQDGTRADFVEDLRGRNVVVIPDTDQAGRKHADNVVAALDGLAKSVAIVWLPHSKDVTEWFENGGTTEELNTLIETAKLPENAPLKSFGKLLRKKGNPAARESEEVVLGAVLDGRVEFSDIEILTAEDFYLTKHRIIFQALQRLHYEVGTTDVKACIQELEEKDRLDSVGGMVALVDLIEDLPASFNIDAHIDAIQNKAKARLLMDGAVKVAENLLVGGSLDEARHKLLGFTDQSVAINPHLALPGSADIAKDIDAFISKRESGIMCRTMPKFLSSFYGMREGNLLVFAGRPGQGKSAMSNLLCASSAMQGHQTDVFSLEVSKEDTLLKMCCAIAQVSFMDVIQGNLTEAQEQRLRRCVERFHKLPLSIDDRTDWTIQKFRTHLKARKAAGNPTRVMCIDYLQLMSAVSKHNRRDLELAEITRGLKILAKEFHLTVILLSQLNRDLEKIGRDPQLSDLKDSGSVEADPDMVCFVVQDTKKDNEWSEERDCRVVIGKNRIGSIGSYKMKFAKRFMIFYELESGFAIDYSAANA